MKCSGRNTERPTAHQGHRADERNFKDRDGHRLTVGWREWMGTTVWRRPSNFNHLSTKLETNVGDQQRSRGNFEHTMAMTASMQECCRRRWCSNPRCCHSTVPKTPPSSSQSAYPTPETLVENGRSSAGEFEFVVGFSLAARAAISVWGVRRNRVGFNGAK